MVFRYAKAPNFTIEITEEEKLDFWQGFGRRIARSHAEREDLDGAVIEEEPMSDDSQSETSDFIRLQR